MRMFTMDEFEGCTCYGPVSHDALKAITSLVTAIIATEKSKCLIPSQHPLTVTSFSAFRTDPHPVTRSRAQVRQVCLFLQ